VSDDAARELARALAARILENRAAVKLIARNAGQAIARRDADELASTLLQLADVVGYRVTVKR
jgi:hypothetical protein